MRSADVSAGASGPPAMPQRLMHSYNAAVSGHRTTEELLTALRKGADLLKHGRLGKPKMHFFRLAEADTHLTWRSSNGKQRSIALATVFQVVAGQTTENFSRHPLPNLARASFSLLYTDSDGGIRSLDLTCRSQPEFELWYRGLHAARERQVALQPAAGPKSAAAFALMASAAQPALKEVRSMTGPLKAPELTPAPSAKHVIGGGTAQGRVTGAMGVPVPEYRPGDCYVWGSCEPTSAGASGQSAAWVCNSAASCVPVLVSDSSHLDVCEASVGRQHAVLVTRGGELFTWGSGSGGKLGLGHTMDACSPQRVHTMWGQTIQHVAAGDHCTAAVTSEGSLYTWGDGAAQNLGYGDTLRQVIPRRVDFGSAQHVLQVSCGPYHSAAVTSSGSLFTWGDGLCGKLGHGNQQSIAEPRQVEGLAGSRVLHVACGVWHTAAVAAQPLGMPAARQLGSADVDPAEWEVIQQKMADAYRMLDEEGGQLYTWGGAFEAAASISLPLTPRLPSQKDDHHGCLGHGDKVGKLKPIRVGGALEGLGVKQVECGLNLTVALTVDGRVWQMGETGAPAEKGAVWERTHVPVQVWLPGLYVGRIAVGIHHAAALAEPLDQRSAPPQAGEKASLIFTWGRGREGQLGNGLRSDCALPQAVCKLQGRHILQVACGGHHTLAVCRHDADREDTEERRRGYKGKMRTWFANTNAALDLATVRSASETSGGKGPTSTTMPMADDRTLSAYDSSSPAAVAAEARGSGGLARKSVMKRASLMGIRAGLTFSNLAQQARRHSDDAYVASHRSLSGLKAPSRSESETSRRATAASEGSVEPDQANSAETQLAAASHDKPGVVRMPVLQQSAHDTQRGTRDWADSQATYKVHLVGASPELGSSTRTSAESGLQKQHADTISTPVSKEQEGKEHSLPRHLSTSQAVASALAASRAQQPPEAPSPVTPDHHEHVHSPGQDQCIQDLRDRVAYLEQVVAQNTGGSRNMQAPILHTALPAVPLSSLQTDPTLKCTPPDARLEQNCAAEGAAGSRSPPLRRLLQLSPERAQAPPSLGKAHHRRSISRSLTLDGVSAAPLWQVDAPKQYGYAEPVQQSPRQPFTPQPPAAADTDSLEPVQPAPPAPEGSCTSSGTHYASAESPTVNDLSGTDLHRSRLGDRPGGPVCGPGSPGACLWPGAVAPHSPLRTNTIDVGSLMGHGVSHKFQNSSGISGGPIRVSLRSPSTMSSVQEGSQPGDTAPAEAGALTERMELLALRRQLREREARLRQKEQQLQSKEADIQATYTRIMFPRSTPQEQQPPPKPEKAADILKKTQQTSAAQAKHSPPQRRAKDEEIASSAHQRMKPEEPEDMHQETQQGSAPSAQHPLPQVTCDAEEMASPAQPQSSASSTPCHSPAAAAAEEASPGCSSSKASKRVVFLSPPRKLSSIAPIPEERAEVPDASGSTAADSAESSCPGVLAPLSAAAPTEEDVTGDSEGAHNNKAAGSAKRSKSAYAAYLDSVASAVQEPV